MPVFRISRPECSLLMAKGFKDVSVRFFCVVCLSPYVTARRTITVDALGILGFGLEYRVKGDLVWSLNLAENVFYIVEPIVRVELALNQVALFIQDSPVQSTVLVFSDIAVNVADNKVRKNGIDEGSCHGKSGRYGWAIVFSLQMVAKSVFVEEPVAGFGDATVTGQAMTGAIKNDFPGHPHEIDADPENGDTEFLGNAVTAGLHGMKVTGHHKYDFASLCHFFLNHLFDFFIRYSQEITEGVDLKGRDIRIALFKLALPKAPAEGLGFRNPDVIMGKILGDHILLLSVFVVEKIKAFDPETDQLLDGRADGTYSDKEKGCPVQKIENDILAHTLVKLAQLRFWCEFVIYSIHYLSSFNRLLINDLQFDPSDDHTTISTGVAGKYIGDQVESSGVRYCLNKRHKVRVQMWVAR